MNLKKQKILVIMTGSIAAYKACTVVSALAKEGFDLEVVMTRGALNFVGRATLEGLIGKAVHDNQWASGQSMEHIRLQRWADLILVIPATATFINRLSSGLAEDLASTLFLAHDFKKPFVIAPAMNTAMYQHPVTQDSIVRLQKMGIRILETDQGVLACGEEGEGKLLDPERILAEVRSQLGIESGKPRATVLITSGGTSERIDQVRVISNVSSGRTGAFLADFLMQNFYSVIYLHARSASLPKENCEKVEFVSFNELRASLHALLAERHIDAVILLAAVSDYAVESILEGNKVYNANLVNKLNSDAQSLQLNLKRNPKILDEISSYSKNKKIKVVAFKLTVDASKEEQRQEAVKLFERVHPNLVVQNDLSERLFKEHSHSFQVYNGSEFSDLNSLDQLGSFLSKSIREAEL